MTNREAVERWARYIIPAVFKAEDALQTIRPEWKERLRNITPENGHKVAEEYCREIARIIVVTATDYEPEEDE